MVKEEQQYDIDLVMDKGIFLQKKDCLDNGSDKVFEICKKGSWEHHNGQIRYKGWKAFLRNKDSLYEFSHRKVSRSVCIVKVDGNEESINTSLTRLNGKNK